MAKKKCTVCGKEKDVRHFPARYLICQLCRNEQERVRYANNPKAAQKSADKVRKWREKQKKKNDE